MSKSIYCIKLKKEAESLDSPPLPGPIGEKILENVSKEAWKNWIQYQTMLINEHRLNMSELQARNFLKKKMEEYFFGH